MPIRPVAVLLSLLVSAMVAPAGAQRYDQLAVGARVRVLTDSAPAWQVGTVAGRTGDTLTLRRCRACADSLVAVARAALRGLEVRRGWLGPSRSHNGLV